MKQQALLFLFLVIIATPALAEERIISFHSDIEVYTDGSMQVTETIQVRAEQDQIKRGIYRDFPTDYKDRFGNRYRVDFTVIKVTRDGQPEQWHSKAHADGVRVYLGNKNIYLDRGDYSYALTYQTNRQLGFFDDHDELYWNVTGNHWEFPIDQISCRVLLPPGIPPEQTVAEAYTGPLGEKGADYLAKVETESNVYYASTRPFIKGEGLTIAVSWPKGFVYKPSTRDEINFLLRDNLSWVILLAGLTLLIGYYLLAWIMVGRDPQAGVIITRYQPPHDLTPGTARVISRMSYDHKAFTSALVNLAVRGVIEINEEDNEYTLKRTNSEPGHLAPGEKAILKHLFRNQKGVSITLKQSKHATIKKALKAHKAALLRNSEKIFFMRNQGWLLPGIIFSIVLFGGVIYGLADTELKKTGLFLSLWLTIWTLGVFSLGKKVQHAWRSIDSPIEVIGALYITAFATPFFVAEIVVIGLLGSEVSVTIPTVLIGSICIHLLFHHLLKAPTRTGRQLLDQLEGFRQFLEIAEREEMNFRNPPDKTPALFERFLPYALALDVEQAWMERFARLFTHLEKSGENYRPGWYHGHNWRTGNLNDFTNAMGSSLSSALATTSVAPGSSSGSGGGGSSGGGGGGGGGGGW